MGVSWREVSSASKSKIKCAPQHPLQLESSLLLIVISFCFHILLPITGVKVDVIHCDVGRRDDFVENVRLNALVVILVLEWDVE